MTENQTQDQPVANLRETRKQMAAARKAHPAGKATPAKKAPAKTPAKKAPAKAPAKKQADKAATPKVRWTLLAERTAGQQAVPATATCGDASYAIAADGEKWKATAKVANKTTVLASGASYAACYRAVVEHARKAVAA